MSSKRVHPKDRDKPDRTFREEMRQRRRAYRLRQLDRDMRDEIAAQNRQRQMSLGEEITP